MLRVLQHHALSTVAAALITFGLAGQAFAETNLRVFSGGQNQRPDLMRKQFDEYEKQNPGVKITIETGGATSELQRQYLSTVLNAKDSAIDIFMIDIVNPAQYAKMGWLEPLNEYVGKPEDVMKPYLPAYAKANVIDGKIAAMPAFADSMFMYYRKDLLEKYGLKEPTNWDELATAAQTVLKGENNPNLQGLSFQGAPIEGTVCTFLLPYWSQGKEFNDGAGKLTFDQTAAKKGMEMWLSMVDKGIAKKNIAEVKTADTVNEFMAGQVVFAINWGFAWDRFKDDPNTKVKGNVGVMKMPAMAGGKSATCVGGWQWAVSGYSKSKAEAAKLVKYMSTQNTSKFLAVEGSLLPVYADVYSDADVVKANPWYVYAKDVIVAGNTRPNTADYAQISDLIRTTTSKILARTITVDEGLDTIKTKAAQVMQ